MVAVLGPFGCSSGSVIERCVDRRQLIRDAVHARNRLPLTVHTPRPKANDGRKRHQGVLLPRRRTILRTHGPFLTGAL